VHSKHSDFTHFLIVNILGASAFRAIAAKWNKKHRLTLCLLPMRDKFYDSPLKRVESCSPRTRHHLTSDKLTSSQLPDRFRFGRRDCGVLWNLVGRGLANGTRMRESVWFTFETYHGHRGSSSQADSDGTSGGGAYETSQDIIHLVICTHYSPTIQTYFPSL